MVLRKTVTAGDMVESQEQVPCPCSPSAAWGPLNTSVSPWGPRWMRSRSRDPFGKFPCPPRHFQLGLALRVGLYACVLCRDVHELWPRALASQ